MHLILAMYFLHGLLCFAKLPRLVPFFLISYNATIKNFVRYVYNNIVNYIEISIITILNSKTGMVDSPLAERRLRFVHRIFMRRLLISGIRHMDAVCSK